MQSQFYQKILKYILYLISPMGFVIREIEHVFIRSDNFQIVDKKKGKEHEANGLAIRRKGKIIIIYKEFDLEMFYRKHCKRISNDDREFTVLVENNIKIPAKDEIRKLIEKVLLDKGKLPNKSKTIIAEIEKKILIPSKYKVRTFFRDAFLDEARDGFFRFRDIKTELKLKELEKLYLNEEILPKEYNEIKKIIESTLNKEAEYIIKETWLIGHTDVI